MDLVDGFLDRKLFENEDDTDNFDPIIEVVAMEHRKKKMSANKGDNSFEVAESHILIKKILPNQKEEAKEESVLPQHEFVSEEYPSNLPKVMDPGPDFYREEVFESAVFRKTDASYTGVKPEEIKTVLRNRVHRAWEKKLGMPIVKDNVHGLVDYFEEYVEQVKTGVGSKVFKHYIV